MKGMASSAEKHFRPEIEQAFLVIKFLLRNLIIKKVAMAANSFSLNQALEALKKGEPIIFPTDTLYGLGVSVGHAQSPEILYELKKRSQKKPVAWLVGDKEDLTKYGKVVPEFALTLARTFWPGPLTIIVKASNLVPEAFRSSEGTIGMRMPNNVHALEMMEKLGCPIATTSANISGQKPTKAFADITPELLEKVEVAFNDDETKSGIASTIVDCTGEHPVMVREGAIAISDIQALS